MHAVLINSNTLDLIATNNGGVAPDAEAWGSYFILPTNPNDHAEIVSADDFDKNYNFVDARGVEQFEPIRPILEFVKTPYKLERDFLAQLVAAHASGFPDAIAEQEDYDFADKMLALLEAELTGENGPCTRCGGDHSWCQNVQDGEFG